MLALAPHFASVNRGVLDRAGKPGRPEVRVFVDDARRFVLGSRDAYDVITLEPLLPYTPGAVHLYTREFYELCRARLAPGGAVCQWFPIHALSPGDFRLLVIWSPARSKNWPNAPTLTEEGINLVLNSPYGVAGPKGMDPKVVKVLADAFAKGVKEPSYIEALKKFDQEVAYLDTAAYEKHVVEQIQEAKTQVEELGLKKK